MPPKKKAVAGMKPAPKPYKKALPATASPTAVAARKRALARRTAKRG